MPGFFTTAMLITILLSVLIQLQQARQMRADMVQSQIINRGIRDEAVIDAMLHVPRHAFVPERYQTRAYTDGPLPIGYNQTISQPYIVAYMTEKLELEPHDKVLEIGTGSGYQAAVLAQIADSVFTIEIIEGLAILSRHKLKDYTNVYCRYGDGYEGWPEHAPYNAIIVTAAPDSIPRALINQLADGGRMIIPVGPVHQTQYLRLITREGSHILQKELLPVRFVPFTRNPGNDSLP